MNQLFLRSNPYSIVLVILFITFSWFIPAFNVSYQYDLFGFKISPISALIISFFFSLIAAITANIQLEKHFFINENSSLFILLFMLISSCSVYYEFMVDLSVLSFLFSIFFSIILSLKEDKTESSHIFNASFLIGVLSLLNYLFLPFIYLIFSGISNSRRVVFKDIILLLLGLAFPFLLLISFSFLTDNYTFLNNVFSPSIQIKEVSILFIVIAILLFFVSFLGIILLKQQRIVFGTKSIRVSSVLVFLYIINYLLAVFNIFYWTQDVYFICIALPTAIFMNVFFLKSEAKLKELLLLLVIISVIGFKFIG